MACPGTEALLTPQLRQRVTTGNSPVIHPTASGTSLTTAAVVLHGCAAYHDAPRHPTTTAKGIPLESHGQCRFGKCLAWPSKGDGNCKGPMPGTWGSGDPWLRRRNGEAKLFGVGSRHVSLNQPTPITASPSPCTCMEALSRRAYRYRSAVIAL